jgi:hypothetical protein
MPVLQKCTLFYVGDVGVVFPLAGKFIFVHEEGMPIFETSTLDLNALGEAALSGLGSFILRDADQKNPDYDREAKVFEANMERLRERSGFGKKKFSDNLLVIQIDREGDTIYLWPEQSTQGKFAFEAACSSDERPSASSDITAEELGLMIQDIIRPSVVGV